MSILRTIIETCFFRIYLVGIVWNRLKINTEYLVNLSLFCKVVPIVLDPVYKQEESLIACFGEWKDTFAKHTKPRIGLQACCMFVSCTALIYRVSQEERSLFSDVIVLITLSKKKKMYTYMFPIPNGFRNTRTVLSLYSPKIVDMKDILHTVSNASIYCSSDKIWHSLLSIIHFRKFHRQHQCTLQLMGGHGALLVCTVYCTVK
jgi:hypothetical protein